MAQRPSGPIRIATAAYPPFVNDCGIYTLIPTEECPKPGIDHEILGQLFAYAKIPYKLYPHTGEVNWGEMQPNGSYDGLIGDVINGKYDTIGAQYLITESRASKVAYSYPIYHDTAMYIVSNAPDPDREWKSKATLIYRVFDWYTSVGLLSVILLLTALLIVNTHVIDAARKGGVFDRAIIMETVTSYWNGLILLLVGKHKYPSLSTRLVFLILAFSVLLMANLYQGKLFTIMVSREETNFGMNEARLIEKLKTKEFHLITTQYDYDYVSFYESIRTGKEDYYEQFRKVLASNPVQIENDVDKVSEILVKQHGYVAYVSADSDMFTKIPSEFDAVWWEGYIFRNGSVWKPFISKNIIMIADFVGAVYRRYRNESDMCQDFSQQPATPLTVMSLLSVFLLLASGGIIGFFMFCYELGRYRRTKRKVKHGLPLVIGKLDIITSYV